MRILFAFPVAISLASVFREETCTRCASLYMQSTPHIQKVQVKQASRSCSRERAVHVCPYLGFNDNDSKKNGSWARCSEASSTSQSPGLSYNDIHGQAYWLLPMIEMREFRESEGGT